MFLFYYYDTSIIIGYAIKVETPQIFVKHGKTPTNCTNPTGKHLMYTFGQWVLWSYENGVWGQGSRIPIGFPAYLPSQCSGTCYTNIKNYLIAELLTCDENFSSRVGLMISTRKYNSYITSISTTQHRHYQHMQLCWVNLILIKHRWHCREPSGTTGNHWVPK